MNWSAFPYLRVAFVFSMGIFTMDYFSIAYNDTWLLGSLVGCWLLSERVDFSIKYQTLIRSLLLLLSIFLLGWQVLYLKQNAQQKKIIPNGQKETVIIIAKISEQLKSTTNQKFLLETQQATIDGESFLFKSDIILAFAGKDTLALSYQPGDKIIVKTKLKHIVPTTNPEAFDYSQYLKSKGILQQGFVKEGEHYLIQRHTHGAFRQYAEHTAQFASNTLSKYFTDTTALGIAEALLIGRKLLISEDIQNAYVNTGAIHVLSVSGLHVAIFISVFIWLFELPKKKSKPWIACKILMLLAIVWFYVILTGMSPSVIRAGFMVSLYIIGKDIFKNKNTYNILSIAAILMLIYNPLYLFQASFQFSFISLLSILYFQPKIKTWWTPSNKILTFIWDLINVSLAAQILMFPFTIYFFHQFPLYFALSGMVAVPLVTIIIYLGTIAIVFEALFSIVSQYLATILEWIIINLNEAIQYISKLPFSIIDGIWVKDGTLLLMVLALLLLILWFEHRSIQVFYMALASVLFVIFNMSMQNLSANDQRQMVIYDTYKGFVIDIYEGRKLKKLTSENITPKSENFAAANNRIKHRVKNVTSLKGNLYNHQNAISYFLTDNADFMLLKGGLKVKYLYVGNTTKNSPEHVLSKVIPEKIILDSNLKPWISKKWLNLQQNGNISIHNIKTDGAFSYTF